MSFKPVLTAAALAAVLVAAGSSFAQTAGAKAPAELSGEALFTENCSACHQVSGMGIPGAFPALAGSAFVQGPPDIVAATVVNGRAGMPAFKEELQAEQLATILTYVRSAWGNKAGPMDVAVVSAAGGISAKAAPSVLSIH